MLKNEECWIMLKNFSFNIVDTEEDFTLKRLIQNSCVFLDNIVILTNI